MTIVVVVVDGHLLRYLGVSMGNRLNLNSKGLVGMLYNRMGRCLYRIRRCMGWGGRRTGSREVGWREIGRIHSSVVVVVIDERVPLRKSGCT